MTYTLYSKPCIYVFGNPDIEMDSLPLKILSNLEAELPSVKFVVQDPNEEWDVPENLIILDTAVGISEVTIFDDLKKFAAVPRVSMHDFDALTNLRYLQKLGKIKEVKIIAVPALSLSNGPVFDGKKTLSDIVSSVADVITRLSQLL